MVVDGEWRLGIQLAPDHTPPEWPDGTPQQLHLDLWIDDLEAAHEEATALGARLLQTGCRPHRRGRLPGLRRPCRPPLLPLLGPELTDRYVGSAVQAAVPQTAATAPDDAPPGPRHGRQPSDGPAATARTVATRPRSDAGSFGRQPGRSTPSMTWMTPLLASTSVMTTFTVLPAASTRLTAPSSPTSTVTVLPLTVVTA